MGESHGRQVSFSIVRTDGTTAFARLPEEDDRKSARARAPGTTTFCMSSDAPAGLLYPNLVRSIAIGSFLRKLLMGQDSVYTVLPPSKNSAIPSS